MLRIECGIEAVVAAGHSLGEYSALVAAGALDFADAVRAVRERGRLMQEACPRGWARWRRLSHPEIAWNDADGNRHEVWYNSPASLVGIMAQLQEKARGLLNDPQYKLPTSFWYRGSECPGFFGTGNALERFYNS